MTRNPLPTMPVDVVLRLDAQRAAAHRARRRSAVARRSALLLAAAPPLARH